MLLLAIETMLQPPGIDLLPRTGLPLPHEVIFPVGDDFRHLIAEMNKWEIASAKYGTYLSNKLGGATVCYFAPLTRVLRDQREDRLVVSHQEIANYAATVALGIPPNQPVELAQSGIQPIDYGEIRLIKFMGKATGIRLSPEMAGGIPGATARVIDSFAPAFLE